MKSTAAFIIFVLAVLGLLFFLSGKRHPRVPNDAAHGAVALSDSTACMECHWQGKRAPLKASHPPKYECQKCHKARIIPNKK
ncbi:MAG: hypothetical protein K8I29_17490 [Alphaproteobacteria bacterium]|uniref:Uncharacterized protein n=1 Tax=Candidatus Nitrobium versatile TaxID=2884831 RepID=A0A953SHF3_9BACT|nr:hypothetical protein [Candidatus Nitrobium versatile]